ncbi:unnamed protein product, partial [Heterosigma akashiwo]
AEGKSTRVQYSKKMLLSRTKGVFLLFCFIAALHLVARPVLAVTGGSSGSFSSPQKSK